MVCYTEKVDLLLSMQLAARIGCSMIYYIAMMVLPWCGRMYRSGIYKGKVCIAWMDRLRSGLMVSSAGSSMVGNIQSQSSSCRVSEDEGNEATTSMEI